MYSEYPHMLLDYLTNRLTNETVGFPEIKSWVQEHTYNRSSLVHRFSHKTKKRMRGYPCNTIGGEAIGKPCIFPFVYPDCSITHQKLNYCTPKTTPREYKGCTDTQGQTMWCSTRNYENNSWMVRNWGYCDPNCSEQNLENYKRSAHITDKLIEAHWNQTFHYFFGLNQAGHCHTYNPRYKSASGQFGQFYVLLGEYLIYLCSCPGINAGKIHP